MDTSIFKKTGINDFKLKPLNLYGKSKLEIDKYFFQKSSKNVIALRFFNVYGNLESHKNDMSSPVSKFTEQLKKNKFNITYFSMKSSFYLLSKTTILAMNFAMNFLNK